MSLPVVPFMIAAVSAQPDGTCEVTLKTGEKHAIEGMTAEQVIAHVHSCTTLLLNCRSFIGTDYRTV